MVNFMSLEVVVLTAGWGQNGLLNLFEFKEHTIKVKILRHRDSLSPLGEIVWKGIGGSGFGLYDVWLHIIFQPLG